MLTIKTSFSILDSIFSINILCLYTHTAANRHLSFNILFFLSLGSFNVLYRKKKKQISHINVFASQFFLELLFFYETENNIEELKEVFFFNIILKTSFLFEYAVVFVWLWLQTNISPVYMLVNYMRVKRILVYLCKKWFLIYTIIEWFKGVREWNISYHINLLCITYNW